MYEVLKKGRLHNLSVKCQYDLFDKIVKPILLYGCEIWGFSNIELLERVQLKFCKLLLNLKKSTPNFMVYGELGVYPLSVSVKVRMVNFWSKLVNGKESKLSNTLYRYIYCQNMRNGFQSTWLNFVKNVLDNSGLNNIWLSQGNFNSKWLNENLKRNLKDRFIQKWRSDMENSSKGICYRLFKENFEFETTGTCFIQKIYAPSSSLLQGKHLPFSPSPLRLNIFRLFVILSLTQLYRYTPEIFLFSTATFKYTYGAPLRRIGQEYSANVAFSSH